MIGKYVVLFLLVILSKSQVRGMKCYVCAAVEAPNDKCATNPAEVEGITTMDCDKKYCFTFRQDYKDPKDKLASISRGCVDKAPCPLGIMEDSTFRYYCTTCQTDLCNNGDGRGASGDTGLSNIDDGYGTLRILGRGDAKIILPSSVFLVFTTMVILDGLI